MSEVRKPRPLPFGDLSKERGKDRLFTIGLALGFILGTVTGATGWVAFVAISVAVFVVVVRTAAQYHWPDRDSGTDG